MKPEPPNRDAHPRRHREGAPAPVAIRERRLDCFVAPLLAMTPTSVTPKLLSRPTRRSLTLFRRLGEEGARGCDVGDLAPDQPCAGGDLLDQLGIARGQAAVGPPQVVLEADP